MLHEGLTTGQAAKYISRHPKTLQAMDRAGVLPARRTASGRRYWLQPDLDRYLGRTAGGRPRRTGGYCPVSSPAQRPGFKNQPRVGGEVAIPTREPKRQPPNSPPTPKSYPLFF